jgi:hypothetical protein
VSEYSVAELAYRDQLIAEIQDLLRSMGVDIDEEQ